MSHLGNWFRDYIAGWIGGIAGLLAGHPFETVKIRQQTKGDKLIKVITITYATEGYKGFYKGMGFPLVTVGVLNSIYFGVYSNTLRVLQHNFENEERLNFSDPHWHAQVFAAGVVGSFVQVLCSCPVEVIKSKLQVNTGSLLETYWKLNYPKENFACENTFITMKDILAHKGYRGFYLGLGAMMWRDTIPGGFYILAYEMLIREVFSKDPENADNKPVIVGMLAGGLSGVLSWSLCVPMDLVKSRLQTDDNKNPKYKGTWDCFRKVYKKEGTRAFTKGLSAILVRAFVSNALIFWTYEKSSYMLSKYVI